MIKIRILLENTCVKQGIVCRHGLSMYVETPAHKVLFDVGPLPRSFGQLDSSDNLWHRPFRKLQAMK